MKPMFSKIFLLSLMAIAVSATEVMHRNIEDLSKKAERVFIGTCLAVEEHFIPEGYSYTEYTFSVKTPVKGEFNETIKIRQIGLINPVQLDNGHIFLGKIPGIPVYRQGEEYMLFLIGDSRKGLTSPIGLKQGAFIFQADKDGEKHAINGLKNAGLFKGVSSTNQPLLKKHLATTDDGQPIPARQLISLVNGFLSKN